LDVYTELRADLGCIRRRLCWLQVMAALHLTMTLLILGTLCVCPGTL